MKCYYVPEESPDTSTISKTMVVSNVKPDTKLRVAIMLKVVGGSSVMVPGALDVRVYVA